MPRNQVVRYNPRNISRRSYNRALRAVVQSNRARALARRAARKAIKYGMNRITTQFKRRASNAGRQLVKRTKTKRMVRILGQAGGTTRTTTRMIVRRTPREQKFLRKMFRNNPIKNMYVNRFGFAWMGQTAGSCAVWYSVTHWKFNNVDEAMKGRIMAVGQSVGSNSTNAASATAAANGPNDFIYIGKCTYSYELYNPTNYIMTVYIYDLICKCDTPYTITYGTPAVGGSCAPENCMVKGSDYVAENLKTTNQNPQWIVADPTLEENNTYWNTVGMKPTDYHFFNIFWKVKGMKKIILPPASSHHHIVVFNPKLKVTKASLYFKRQDREIIDKVGIGRLS